MRLQTQIPIKKQPFNQIDYRSKILLLGSCFAENIGEKFKYFKFQSLQNPFGILYHPKAIEILIQNAINEKVYDESDVLCHNERWHCFEAHSDLSSASKEELLQHLNVAIKTANQRICDATHIIITLGTAWLYRFIETDKIVANCHKIPQKKFLKQIQSVKSVIESLESVIHLIRSVNRNTAIILTVSPIRHLKDGFIENTQSKSHLISAIHQIVEPRNSIYYFPSFEIMMDELRDYRFYAEDLIHPNKTGINYIWDKFKMIWISSEAFKTMDQVDSIQNGMNHKPFNPESEQHKRFIKKLELQKTALKKDFPHILF